MSAAPRLLYRDRLPAGAACLLCLIPSLDYIQKYTGQVGLVAFPLIALSAIFALTAIARRCGPHVSRILVLCSVAVTLALFMALYPMANSGLLGAGSDRDDALNVALQALLAGQYPYNVVTYLGNPPTPMPGALILALPFFVIGNSAFQNLIWIPTFAWWCLRHFESATTTFLFLAIFLIGCPASLGDFVTGGDYLVNAIYVTIAMDVVLRAQHGERTWSRYAASIFLSIAISSRPVYAMAATTILAGSIFQTGGARRTLEFIVVVVLICAALNGPFYLYDPSRFPTAHLSEKLSVFPQFVHAAVVLPALGTAIACLSFFLTMGRNTIFGLMAAALGAMFYPVIIFELVTSSFDASTLWTASYSLPVTIFGGLWISGAFWAQPTASGPSLDNVGFIMAKDRDLIGSRHP